MDLVLATTYHDARDRLFDQIAQVFSVLTEVFNGIAVQASPAAPERSTEFLAKHGAFIKREEPPGLGIGRLGLTRRMALASALELGASHLLFFDFDSLLHWAQYYPDELRSTVGQITEYDFAIIGRTQRALDSHPRSQRDTEVLVNEAFARLTGHNWDVMRSGRGLSRSAAAAIVADCHEEGISADVVWPLFLLNRGFVGECLRVEGTEFETGDRYGPEIAAAGSYDAWLRLIDADPRRWAHRLDLARQEVEAMIPFAGPDTHLAPRSV